MNIRFERNRTSTFVIMYSLYLYFLGLSLRNTSKALIIFKNDKRNMFLYDDVFKNLVHPIYMNVKASIFRTDETIIYRLAVNISGYG
jgi:hypothetical protein